jgi:hypothetical protein
MSLAAGAKLGPYEIQSPLGRAIELDAARFVLGQFRFEVFHAIVVHQQCF